MAKNFFQKPVFPWLITLVMLGLNGVLLTFLWTGRKPPMRKPHHQRIQVEDILGFDDRQRTAFKAEFDAHRARMDSIRDGMHALRREIFDGLKAGRPVDSLTTIKFNQLGSHFSEVEAEIYTHFLRVRGMCTDAQRVKFDKELLPEILQPKHKGLPGPPPEGRHPH